MSNKYEFVISAQDKTGQAFASINRGIGGLTGNMTKAAGAVAAVTATFVALTSRAATNASELKTMAALAGVSVEEFQSLTYAMTQFNVTQDQLADISKDVQDKLGEFVATGGGAFKDFFDQVAPKVGLTAAKLQEMSGPDVLIAVKNAMDQVNISAKEQVFYLEAIANDATKLMPALKDNGKELRQLQRDYDSLNISLSESEVEKLNDFNKEMNRLKTIIDGIGNKIGLYLVDPLNEINDYLAGGAVSEHFTRFNRVVTGIGVSAYSAAAGISAMGDAMGIDLLGDTKELSDESKRLMDQWTILDNRLNGIKTNYQDGFGETKNIFSGLEDPFNTEGAVTNILSESEKAANIVREAFMDIQAFNVESMFSGSENDYWASFAETGVYAFDTLQEQSDGFWESLRGHIETTSSDFDTMWGNTFDRFASGIGEATATALTTQQSFGDASREIARGAIQSVIQGLVEIGVKKVALWAIEKAITSAGAKTNEKAVIGQAATASTAWATPAALASLATGGANAIPAQTGILSTVALSNGLSAIPSFEGGGYTWDGARAGGMDGKGGRLAMLHPREVVTDLTKSQPGQGISVDARTTINGNVDSRVMGELLLRDKTTMRKLQRLMSKPI